LAKDHSESFHTILFETLAGFQVLVVNFFLADKANVIIDPFPSNLYHLLSVIGHGCGVAHQWNLYTVVFNLRKKKQNGQGHR